MDFSDLWTTRGLDNWGSTVLIILHAFSSHYASSDATFHCNKTTNCSVFMPIVIAVYNNNQLGIGLNGHINEVFSRAETIMVF